MRIENHRWCKPNEALKTTPAAEMSWTENVDCVLVL